jgi:Ca2+-transporting ATPase
MNWHLLAAEDAARNLSTDIGHGLSRQEAARRLERDGPNELQERGGKGPWHILWEQFTSVMVLILIGAALLSLAMGKHLETVAILGIVVLFGLLGFFQEYRAERAIAALKRLSSPRVRVVRDGAAHEVDARELVVGDLVVLEAGNLMPADLRWVETINLRVEEAALTGESEPVEKQVAALERADEALGDRRNMGYCGTRVTYGRGRGLVVGVGMATELGKIASLLTDVKSEPTPLQRRLDSVGKQLAVVGALAALTILAVGVASGESLADMLLTAISVAVAVIPEGLPAVVTFTLARGAQRMLRRDALIRKLPAVETLGSVTTICSDKTGTLTQNRMTVTVVDVAGHRLALDDARGDRAHAASAQAELSAQSIGLVLIGGAMCNDAELNQRDDGETVTLGDPTETALLAAAQRAKLSKAALLELMPRVGELPFDSERKRMTTAHRRPQDQTLHAALGALSGGEHAFVAFTKGAVDGLLEISSKVWIDGQSQPASDEHRRRILAANAQLASGGMRVLGVAFREVPHPDLTLASERELTFVGMLGLIDPPRPEVREAVARCADAGIRPVMITGDHPLTAAAIARELGIKSESDALTGAQLQAMSQEQLQTVVQRVGVFARVAPEHKLRIVAALQKHGHVVAMTGDGVNDAPALEQANIGVAMGITGSDVSKEAADMVLRDDNFATIVAAVEEGRVIYDNLRRFVQFAVAGNIGKVGAMLLWPLPFLAVGAVPAQNVALLPLQLLWLNLMTDGLLGLSLGAEPAERDVMRRPPHSPSDGIFSGGLGLRVLWNGAFIALTAVAVGFWSHQRDPLGPWQTLMFTTLAVMQMFQALATRSSRESLFRQGLLSNPTMLGVLSLVLVLQIAALHAPHLSSALLRTQPLGALEWGVAAAAGASLLAVSELEKWFVRARSSGTRSPDPLDP